MLSASLAALHLVSVAFALVTLVNRARSFAAPIDDAKLREAQRWDSWALVASVGLYGAGLYRLFGGVDKPLAWYTSHPLFWLKMGLLAVILLLEVPTMWTLLPLEFRRDRTAPFSISSGRARLCWMANWLEVGASVSVIVVAAFMARGMGRTDAPKARADNLGCQVQTTFQSKCLTCHSTTTRLGGLDLQADPHGALVSRPSTAVPGAVLVVPSSAPSSLLYRKLRGEQEAHEGARMPLDAPLDAASIELVHAWISGGAPPCVRP